LYDWFLDALQTPHHPQQIEFAPQSELHDAEQAQVITTGESETRQQLG